MLRRREIITVGPSADPASFELMSGDAIGIEAVPHENPDLTSASALLRPELYSGEVDDVSESMVQIAFDGISREDTVVDERSVASTLPPESYSEISGSVVQILNDASPGEETSVAP